MTPVQRLTRVRTHAPKQRKGRKPVPASFDFVAEFRPRCKTINNGTVVSRRVPHVDTYFWGYFVGDWILPLRTVFKPGRFLYRFWVSRVPRARYTKVIIDSYARMNFGGWTAVHTDDPKEAGYAMPCGFVLEELLGPTKPNTGLPAQMYVRMTRHTAPPRKWVNDFVQDTN